MPANVFNLDYFTFAMNYLYHPQSASTQEELLNFTGQVFSIEPRNEIVIQCLVVWLVANQCIHGNTSEEYSLSRQFATLAVNASESISSGFLIY